MIYAMKELKQREVIESNNWAIILRWSRKASQRGDVWRKDLHETKAPP